MREGSGRAWMDGWKEFEGGNCCLISGPPTLTIGEARRGEHETECMISFGYEEREKGMVYRSFLYFSLTSFLPEN